MGRGLVGNRVGEGRLGAFVGSNVGVCEVIDGGAVSDADGTTLGIGVGNLEGSLLGRPLG